MDKTERIFVAGHRGLAGSALVRALQAKGFKNLVTRDRTQLDLMDEVAVTSFFSQETTGDRDLSGRAGRRD